MTYSINWPSGFESQTTNPASRFFVGRIGVNARPPQEPKQAPWSDVAKKPSMQVQRLKTGSNKWLIYELIKKVGPLPRSAIACHLQLNNRRVDECTLRLVKAGVLTKGDCKKQPIYSLGTTVVIAT